MKKTKVIHLLCHSPHPAIKNIKNPVEYFLAPAMGDFQKIAGHPYWVGFFAQDHHALAARELKLLTDEFEVECWRPYGLGIKRDYQKTVQGILHRIFPCRKITLPKIATFLWSASLYKALISEIQANNVILNVSVGHDWFHIILFLKLRKYKDLFGLVALHRSSGFRMFNFKSLPWYKKLYRWNYLIEHYFDIKSLKYSDHYFSGSLMEAKYLHEKHPKLNSSFHMEGIDFTKYRVLNKAEKLELRKEIGLPIDKNILIAQGNWRSAEYGYQHLIECYKKVKQSGRAKNLQLVMTGGYKTEDLYAAGLQAGVIMVERCSKEIFIKYLEASDFFTQAAFSYEFINWGGFGTAMIEALACGLPVISNNIIHYPGTNEERNGIGLEMPTKEKLVDAIIFMNESYPDYTSCRELAKKYFNIENTRLELVKKYRELSVKYFRVN